ncbi:MAG: DegT/DnrJ/EryC1/StrS family aminotransferase [Bacteroidota bacterium]
MIADKTKKIAITRPSITQLEIDYVNDAISNGWGERCYDYIKRFENEFAGYLGSKHALATSSCTGAIHLALMALGVKAGDEVIIPDITWIASVEPVLYIGAKPVFVDVLPDSWCIDPKKIEAAITPKTKAIVVVHLYGNMAEMDEILAIAKKHGLKILEDAAEALGSTYYQKKAGSIGDAGVFSFHGTKTVSTGEGGMMVTSDDSVIERARILNDHGRDPKVGKTFWMAEYGYKYKISNLQAAMGCAQIERVEELVEKKRKIFSWYKDLFSDTNKFQLNPEPEYIRNSVWMPTVIFNHDINIDRDGLMSYLKENGIDSRPFFYPLTSLPLFEEKKENIVSYDLYGRGINLPSHPGLEFEDIEIVYQAVIKYIN